MKYAVLSIVVIAWCVLHSAMIASSVTDYLQKWLGPKYRFYRLFFNTVAVLTLIPVILFASTVRAEPIFSWAGYMRIVQVLLLGTSALLFFRGAQRYDTAQFLGFNQICNVSRNTGITASGKLDTSGILSAVRHPWYLASILLIWSWPMDISSIIVNTILTCYLVTGSYLEERKLIREFGEEYLEYQRRVSMLIPYKWLKSKITK